MTGTTTQAPETSTQKPEHHIDKISLVETGAIPSPVKQIRVATTDKISLEIGEIPSPENNQEVGETP